MRPVSMLTLPSPYGKSVVFPLGLGQPAAALRPSLPRRQGSGILRSMSVLMPPSDKGPLFAHPYSQLPEPVLAPARPQPPAPDETCCTALWEKYAMPPHIRRHCKVVAHIACTLAGRALARGFEVEFVPRAYCHRRSGRDGYYVGEGLLPYCDVSFHRLVQWEGGF